MLNFGASKLGVKGGGGGASWFASVMNAGRVVGRLRGGGNCFESSILDLFQLIHYFAIKERN